MRLRALAAGLSEGHVTILHRDLDGRYDLAENLPSTWPAMLGQRDENVFNPELSRRFDSAAASARQTGTTEIIDFEYGEASARRIFEAHFRPDRDAQGAAAGTTIVVTDVTERHNRELAVGALMREVSHRSKNLLAIVQSIAMQTARHSSSVQDYLDRFRGRLHALSSTQDLVTESNWRGSYLRSLINSQLVRIGQPSRGRITIEGDNPLLTPNASLHVGLAIHELATNAVLHGALGQDGSGGVVISARVSAADGRSELVIDWRESPVPASDGDAEPRFGTLVLERVVPLSMGGEASYVTAEGQLRYTLTIPSNQYEV